MSFVLTPNQPAVQQWLDTIAELQSRLSVDISSMYGVMPQGYPLFDPYPPGTYARCSYLCCLCLTPPKVPIPRQVPPLCVALLS